jgi:hypothetical protein
MKLGRLAGIVITLAWVLNLNAHVQAETKKLIYESGRQGVSWAVCHDVWQDSQRDLASQARQFGYSTELSSEQVEVPYALMQSLR